MHSNKPTRRRQAKRLGAMVVAASMLLETVTPAFAGVSQLPGLYITPPDASVMFTLDDSGSMQSDAIPDFSLPGATTYADVPTDSSSTFFGFLKYPDMWGSGSSYLSAKYYKKSNAIARYMRSSSGNPLYYDPAVRYRPWPLAAATQNPGRMTPADPTKVNVSTDDPSATAYQLNLTVQKDSGGTGTGEDRYYWPATYYIYDKLAPPLADATPNDPNNTATNFTKVEIQGSGTATFANSSIARTDCSAGVCTRVAEMQNFANWLQYYRNRRLMAKGGAAAAFAAQGTNLRTGFTMIGQSSVLRKMRPFTGADRTDFFTKLYTTTSSDGFTPLRNAMDVVGQYFTTSDKDSPWATTPGTSVGTESECRRAFHVLSTDGFWNNASASTTAAKANNDNFSGTTPSKPNGTTYTYSDSLASTADPLVGRFTINPFADSNADLLADVAAYYWKTDLRSTLPNRVPPSTRDPAFWQHLQTFTIGLGISGSGGVKRHSDLSTKVTQPPAPAPAVATLVPYLGHPWLADQAVRDYLIKNKVALDWTKPAGGGDDAATGDDLIHASMDGRGKYFSAKNPAQLSAGLSAALAEATDNPGSLANVVTQSPQVLAGSAVYQATYNPAQWSGRLYAFGQAADGTVVTTPGTEIWEASNKMPTPLPPSPPGRKIYTWNPDAAAGSTFTWGTGGLTATQKANLGDDSTLLDFLRGSDANEVANGGTFRDRARYATNGVAGGVLGDIVNGSPIKGPTAGGGYDRLPVGAAGRDTYASFRSASSTGLDNMRNTIYLGANDGMLHAFSNADGAERFAYVPNSVFSVPVTSSVTELKLKMLSDPGYLHRFTVDGPPQIGDAYVKTPSATIADWRSVLVGSTGAGARSVFAIDVTNPASGVGGLSQSNVLWEFSDANNSDMGYVINYPHVARMQDGTWVSIFGNGYDSKNGQAKLFILNLQTGAVLWQPTVGAAGGNGLSQPNFTVNNNREVTAIYAGDLKGNLWKFDVNNPDPTKWKVAFGSAPNYAPLFAGSANQPITVMPEITFHDAFGGTIVSFGTGELFKTEDTAAAVAVTTPPTPQVNVNLNTQAIYGIWDKPGELTGFSGNSSLVLQSGTAAVAANANAKLTGTTTNTVDWTSKRGWYMNLGTNNGERVNVNPQQINDVLLVVSNNPDNDPCSSGGSARLFVLDPITGGAPSFAVFDSNGVGGITSADKGFNVKSFSFGVLSLPTLQSKKTGSDTVTTESTTSRGQTGARLGGVENKPRSATDCAKWLLAGGSDTSISGVDMATCGSGNARISWRQLK